MAKAHYFYFQVPLSILQKKLEAHQAQFDLYLEETFDEEELKFLEKYLDNIGAIYVQPILEELSFDDFYPDPELEQEQKAFFESCVSSVCLENLPYLESNPFQVSYLIQFISGFEAVLIDRGGIEQLQFKDSYLEELMRFKNIDSLTASTKEKKPVIRSTNHPVNPIDFMIIDVYFEIERIKDYEEAKINSALSNQCEKVIKIFKTMQKGSYDAFELLTKTGLSPKEFDDNLERLKFTLKKI